MDKDTMTALMAAAIYPGIIALQVEARRTNTPMSEVTEENPMDGAVLVAEAIWLKVFKHA